MVESFKKVLLVGRMNIETISSCSMGLESESLLEQVQLQVAGDRQSDTRIARWSQLCIQCVVQSPIDIKSGAKYVPVQGVYNTLGTGCLFVIVINESGGRCYSY